MDRRALNPVKGKIRRLLDQCKNKIHIFGMGCNAVCVYVTHGKDLVLLNKDLAKAEMLSPNDFFTNRDLFPDQFIQKLNKSLISTLGIYADFEIHSVAISPNTELDKTKTGQE